MKTIKIRFVLMLIAAATGAMNGQAEGNRTEIAQIESPLQYQQSEFGRSIAMDGEFALISAPGEFGSPQTHDATYLFHRDGTQWSESVRLEPVQASISDYFGASVAISVPFLALGGPLNDQSASNSGAVSVYVSDGSQWQEQAWLKASDPDVLDQFGCSVAIDPDWLMVGACWKTVSATQSGAVYVFHREGDEWTEFARLDSGSAVDYEYFGRALSMDSGRVLIGTGSLYSAGVAYVYRYNGSDWVQEAVLIPNESEYQDRFGYAVSIEGETAMVGAPYSDNVFEDSGAVYCFRYANGIWTEEARLLPHDTAPTDQFGYSVSLDGPRMLVGAPSSDFASSDAGTAYVFEYRDEAWVELERLTPSDPVFQDFFGLDLGLQDNMALVGAPLKDGSAQDTGVVYVFDLDESSTPVPTTTPVMSPTPTPLPGHYWWTGAVYVHEESSLPKPIEGAWVSCDTYGGADTCITSSTGQCSVTLWAFDIMSIHLNVTAEGYLPFTDSFAPWPQFRQITVVLTPIPVDTPTPDPALTPTPTPECPGTRATLWMPSHLYHGGDTCSCIVTTCRTPSRDPDPVHLFVVLDCMGAYYFAPSFGPYDVFDTNVPEGLHSWTVLSDFTWPEQVGTGSGVRWIAAMTDSEVSRIIGEADIWEFEWTD